MRSMLVLGLAVAMWATACGRLTGGGDGSSPDRIEHPTARDALVLRMHTGGGFVPLTYRLRELPSVSLVGDGTLIVQGPQIEIYPGPALPNLVARTVSEEGIQAILRAAREAGLMSGNRDLGTPAVADAPATTVTVAAGGAVHVTRAYALEEAPQDDSQLTPEQRQARRKLAEFRMRLGDIERWLPDGSVGEERFFRFDELRIFVLREPMQGEELPQREVRWPLATPLGRFGEELEDRRSIRCGTVEGDELQTLLPDARRANELTPWTSGDETYHLVFRPLLPDESGCIDRLPAVP